MRKSTFFLLFDSSVCFFLLFYFWIAADPMNHITMDIREWKQNKRCSWSTIPPVLHKLCELSATSSFLKDYIKARFCHWTFAKWESPCSGFISHLGYATCPVPFRFINGPRRCFLVQIKRTWCDATERPSGCDCGGLNMHRSLLYKTKDKPPQWPVTGAVPTKVRPLYPLTF